eukprot:TRINITY_DN19891_c0_g1_i1.p1 TRINITY_DN19891_c0_g1~~TRINITY_DN19891_c0_g1_i1.p1  ORF type:complete len:268 (-),score=35.34 TRINITY_DN19891_c0_g1_i1:847-1650(-)
MRKRERENPCAICGHYHKYEEGEVCNICGHRLLNPEEKGPQQSAFSSEILQGFLYVGSYDNASRSELLKAQGIRRILNTVPSCQNLYRNSFTYHCITNEKALLPFDECFEFIEASRQENERVLVHCMSGQTRSPAVVIAYLMRHKGWRLPQSYQWVKDRHPCTNITPAMGQHLQEYELHVFGSNQTPLFPTQTGLSFGFGFNPPQQPQPVPIPNFGLSAPQSLLPNGTSAQPAMFGFTQTPAGESTFVFGSSSGGQVGPESNNMDSS